MKKDYTLNKVDGFNPYDHIETALDRTGEPIIKKDGTELKYMSTAAKVLWFRMARPNGRINVIPVSVDSVEAIEIPVRYRAEVYLDHTDAAPVASWEYQETLWDIADMDRIISRVQTVALGKALSKAGFGCEIEMELDLGNEGEIPEEKEPPKPVKKKAPKKAEKTENVEQEVADLLSSIAAEAEADEPEEETVDLLEKALKTVVVCKENAPVNIKKIEGKALEDVVNEYPSFCRFVKTKKNVREAVSEETAEAAIYIADNL